MAGNLEMALALARRGLHVLPCLPRAKLPATEHGFRDATADLAVIEWWWRRQPNYNIGVATGPLSGIFVVDVDGEEAEATLRKLEAEHGPLPPTVESVTPRPGRQVFFRYPDRPVRNSAGLLGKNLDVRGDGGFVIVPRSIHPSGRSYEWSVDSADAFAAAPAWLLDRIAPNGNGHDATPPAVWRDLVRTGVAEGQRNDSIARLAGMLLRRRVDAVVVLELLTAFNAARCQPPLDEAEVATVVDSIAARELKRRGAAP